jgi:molecular chaperone DnaK (HSP70)
LFEKQFFKLRINFFQVGISAKQLAARMPYSVILGCKSGIGKKSDNLAESSKKVGAKPVLTDKGEVVYEVEGGEGKNKKVPAHDAMKEIYKYMHGKPL